MGEADDAPGAPLGETPANDGAAVSDASIRGRIIDDLITPLEGALVFLKSASDERTATADADGLYAFEGVPAMPHNIVGSAAGHESVLEEILVREGRVHWVNFTLRIIPVIAPYVDEIELSGYVDCEWGSYWPAASQPCGLRVSNVAVQPFADPNRKMELRFNADPFLAQMHFEATWTASLPPAEAAGSGTNDLRFFVHEMLLDANGSVQENPAGEPLGRYGHGPWGFRPPVRWNLSAEQLDLALEVPQDFGNWRTFEVRVQARPTGLAGLPPSIVYNQPFTVKVAFFYVDPAPEGWTFA